MLKTVGTYAKLRVVKVDNKLSSNKHLNGIINPIRHGIF